MKGWGKREILKNTRRQAASSGTIPTCENPGEIPPVGVGYGNPSDRQEAPSTACSTAVDQFAFLSRNLLCMQVHTAADTRRWSGAEIQGQGKREYPEKTRRQAASPSTIPTCENPGSEPARDRNRIALVGGYIQCILIK
ncbi:hypothetical protein PR048_020231 [Dryococelus australis]|uniref:Uncharacterized protein n=1 Tax=Dryococelus australis TaxID=614101 RepID=A0ABQ9H632_9NEOP|nr:hypothetical protein PR048_020231 [Dryococelus australis]